MKSNNKNKEEIINSYNNLFGKENCSKLLKLIGKGQNSKYIRINFAKETLLKFFKKNRVTLKKTFLPSSFKIEKTFFNLSSTIYNLSGYYHLQDIASQLPLNMINYKKHFSCKDITVLDMAASPGSKTTQIFYSLQRDSYNFNITALEPNRKRLTKLINNLQKQRCQNITVYNIKGEEFKSEMKYDLIILDAPCSGNLYNDKYWFNKRSLKGINQMARLQRKLIENGFNHLKKNGIMIYSTCSLQIEENENNVIWALNRFKKQITLIDSDLKFPFKTKPYRNIKAYRFMPYETGFQGFFVALFKRL